MISQNAKKHADACRFCWMCRHLCPIGLKTGKEVNTPRAKGLLLSMVERGTTYSADIAQAMYDCMLCDACTNDCVTGYEPPLFIREARTQAIVDGLAPAKVLTVLKRIEKTGNIYGVEKTDFGHEKKADVLLMIGETAACAVPQMARSLMSLLDKAQVEFTVLNNEPPTGTMLGDLVGFVAEVEVQAKACAEAIAKTGAKTVVVLDSYDAVTLKQCYPEWGCPISAEVVTASSYVDSLIKAGRLSPNMVGGMVSYHDDSRLARTLHEFEPVRNILSAMGIEVREMFQNHKLAKCCGTSLAKAYMPETTHQTACGRWEDFMRVTGADTLVVANPQALEVLAVAVPTGKTLADVYTLLDAACP